MFELVVVRACLLSLLPGFFWLVYLRSLSPHRKISAWLWLWALVLGGASTQLTLWASDRLGVDALMRLPVLSLLIYFVLGVGFVEEAAKAICAFLGLSLSGLARDPLVTLQLSGAVALGFATAENVLYVLSYGEGVLVGRFLFSTLGHVLFSSVWGFALGAREVGADGAEHPRWRLLLLGLLLSGLAHGLYDWFLTTDRLALAVLILGLLWFGFRQAILATYLRQEYERALPYDTRECPSCTVLTRADGSYCSFCGEAFARLPSRENA